MAKTGSGDRHRLANDLRHAIADGEWQPGDWLPSEAGLIDRYGVSRYSVREALKRLAADGLIITVDGRGSHVAARTRAAFTDARAVTTDATGALRDTETAQWSPVESPTTYRTAATVELALALSVPEHTPLFVRDALLSPTADYLIPGATARRLTHRTYIPLAVYAEIPALEHNPFPPPDQLYAALTGAGHHLRITERVRLTTPTPDDATALGVTPGGHTLTTHRVIATPTGRVLALEETHRNAHDTQLTYTIAD